MAQGKFSSLSSRPLLGLLLMGALGVFQPQAQGASVESSPQGGDLRVESSEGSGSDSRVLNDLGSAGEVELSPAPASPRLPAVISAPEPAEGVAELMAQATCAEGAMVATVPGFQGDVAMPSLKASDIPPEEASPSDPIYRETMGWSLSPEVKISGDVAAAPTADEALEDAAHHALNAVRRYISGDMPSVEAELDKALELVLEADLPHGKAGLLLIQETLPPAYADYDLVRVYADALRATAQGEEALTPVDELVEHGPGIGGPQGIGEPVLSNVDPEDITKAEAKPLNDSEWITQEIERIAQAFGETEVGEHETFQGEVERFISYYQNEKRGFFDRSLARSLKYMPMVEGILAEKGVPPEMAYIAFVESGFRPRATSRASARGLWQFMPRTARAYGLKVDKDVDQRLDPYLSTIAAREYFLDLVAIFGSRSFLLAMASYNAGEGRVQGCLKRLDDPFTQRTFWHIAPCLRLETREYIPRIIAAAIIAQSPERFGFTPYGTIGSDDYDILEIYQPTSVAQLARWADVSLTKLRSFNPDLMSSDTTTPKDMDAYRLVVPGGAGEEVLAALIDQAARAKTSGPNPPARIVVKGGETLPDELVEELLVAQSERPEEAPSRAKEAEARGKVEAVASVPAVKKAAPKSAPKTAPKKTVDHAALEATRFVRYAVQPGNTTQEIAQDFGKPVSKLLEWNPYLEEREAAEGDIIHIYELPSDTARHVAKVQAGDTLSQIAEVYGVSSSKIARWNGVEPHRIYVGQSLVIYTEGPLPGAEVEPVIHRITYVVKPGNNLSRLSGYFGVGMADIKALNDLSSDTIVPGQRLVIETPNKVEVIDHKVTSGESLGSISQRYNVKLSFLADTNGLSRNAGLRVGQTLTVYVP